MKTLRVLVLGLLNVNLTGCSALQSPGGRIALLVLVPAVLIGIALYLLRRREPRKGGGRGPRYPDYDERE